MLGLAALIGLSAGVGPGCDNGSSVCSLADGSGCANGQVCIAGTDGEPVCGCSVATEAGCEEGTVCEEVPGANPVCFAPVTLGGKVFDLASGGAVEGAHVVARDANFAALTGVAVTDAAGHYVLTVPVPRDEDGTLLERQVFLRADAQGYLTFPAAPRVALPIDMSKATGDPPHVESAASDVGLGTVTGKVVAGVPTGALVVAGGEAMTGGGATGIADTDGSYTVFNVPAGTVAVQG